MFPFPCVLDFGLLTVEISRNCVVLKRAHQQYPHVTLFYEPRKSGGGRGCWCPHVTWYVGGRRRHEDLARWRPEHAKAASERFHAALLPRFCSVLHSVTLEQLADENWILVEGTEAIVRAYVGLLLEGRKTLVFDRLEDIDASLPDGPLGEALQASLRHPTELVGMRPSGPLWAFRLDETGCGAGAVLHGFALDENGPTSWFLAPQDILDATPEEMLHHVMPGLYEHMWRVFDILELPLPSPRMETASRVRRA